jgi:hypothetical protein
VGFASVLTGGGDLLLSAHEEGLSGRSRNPRYQNRKAVRKDCPFRPLL